MKKHYAYFSAAILDGAKLREQAVGATLTPDGRTCVLNAGYHAVTGNPACGLTELDELQVMFPYLNRIACHPVNQLEMDLYSIAMDLNDAKSWTREQVADWLYAEEEKLGFVTVLDTQDASAGRGDSNVTQDCQASLPEEVFV